jgi:hypothetical protein
LQQMPCLIVTVTAGAVQGIAYSTVQDVLSRRPELWTSGQLRDLAHAIAGNKLDWRGGFEGEHAMFLDTMQRFYTDDGHGDGHLAFRGPEGLNVFDALTRFTGNGSENPFSYDSLAAAVMPAANMVIASRKEMTDLYNEKHNEAILRMDTPLWQLPKGPWYDPEFVISHGNPLKKTRHLFVALMQPAYDKLRNKLAVFDGNRDGALIGIALELYHRDHKVWPKSLEELSPRWLPSVPLDQTTGKALGYKIVDDQPEVYNVRPSPLVEEEKPLNSLELPITKTIPSGSLWVIWSTAPKS